MTVSTSAPHIDVHTQGSVSAADVDYARAKVQAAVRHAHEPVLSVRVRLTVVGDPAVSRPAIAQANVNLNGRTVRAQIARETLRVAVDEMHDRLRNRLQRAARDWQAIRGARPVSDAHEWRHASVPTERPRYFPLPPEQRRIVRHKTFTLRRATVDEAAFDMELLGYQFHLFTEDGTGSDSVLYRVEDDPCLHLSQVDPQPDRVTPGAEFVIVSERHPPELSVDGAVQRLDITGWPFVFFRSAETGRGCVVYHRYDGHYGLITSAA